MSSTVCFSSIGASTPPTPSTIMTSLSADMMRIERWIARNLADAAAMTEPRLAADDERAIRALVLAYAHHADRRQPELLAELFEPDATLRMVWRSGDVPSAESRGHKQIAAAVGQLRRMAATFHLVGNHSIEGAGDSASGEVYCEAHHLASDGLDFVMFIRYLDRYRRDGDGWRFAERETFVEWTEERAPASRA